MKRKMLFFILICISIGLLTLVWWKLSPIKMVMTDFTSLPQYGGTQCTNLNGQSALTETETQSCLIINCPSKCTRYKNDTVD